MTKERAEWLAKEIVIDADVLRTCTPGSLDAIHVRENIKARLAELIAAASAEPATQKAKPIKTPEEHKAYLAEVESLMMMDEVLRSDEQTSRLDLLVELVWAYEQKHFPIPSSDALRWQAIKPFLRVERDGDEDGSWATLTIHDEGTGVDSVEIAPAKDTHTPNAFADRLSQYPWCRVGYRVVSAASLLPEPPASEKREQGDTNAAR